LKDAVMMQRRMEVARWMEYPKGFSDRMVDNQ